MCGELLMVDVVSDFGRGWRHVGQHLRGFLDQLGQFGGQRDLKEVINVLHEVKLHRVPDEVGKIGEVALIVHGKHCLKDAGAVSRQQLFL